MGRAKEEPRGRLGTLQDMLSGGVKLLVDQAQFLRGGLEKTLVDVGRGVEGQLVGLVASIEDTLTQRLDLLLNRLAVTLRRDTDRVRERVRAIENRLADVPKEGLRELLSPLQAAASGAAETAAAAAGRIEELEGRIQHVERRTAELGREAAQGQWRWRPAPAPRSHRVAPHRRRPRGRVKLGEARSGSV
jgi:hypothetical protein